MLYSADSYMCLFQFCSFLFLSWRKYHFFQASTISVGPWKSQRPKDSCLRAHRVEQPACRAWKNSSASHQDELAWSSSKLLLAPLGKHTLLFSGCQLVHECVQVSSISLLFAFFVDKEHQILDNLDCPKQWLVHTNPLNKHWLNTD